MITRTHAHTHARTHPPKVTIDPTKIHEYKHNYDESEWAMEPSPPGPASEPGKNSTSIYSSKASKFFRMGPPENSMACLWATTKQQSCSFSDQTNRNGFMLTTTTTSRSALEDNHHPQHKMSKMSSTGKRSRTWPVFHHSPPYSMSHYHVPRTTSTKQRGFSTIHHYG